MQGPPVYRIITFKAFVKEEILDRLGGCNFQGHPYIIDIKLAKEEQVQILELLELYFSKKLSRELRLYPLYVVTDESIPTAHFYLAKELEEIAVHFKEQEKKNLTASESAKLKLYQAGIDHFHSIPPINKKAILLAYTDKRKELWKEMCTNRFLQKLDSEL